MLPTMMRPPTSLRRRRLLGRGQATVCEGGGKHLADLFRAGIVEAIAARESPALREPVEPQSQRPGLCRGFSAGTPTGEYRSLLCNHVLEVFDGSLKWRCDSPTSLRRPPGEGGLRADYFPILRGSFMGTCREVLFTRGPPSELVRLMSVSKTKKNFSASMCVSSERLAQRRPSGA